MIEVKTYDGEQIGSWNAKTTPLPPRGTVVDVEQLSTTYVVDKIVYHTEFTDEMFVNIKIYVVPQE